MNISNEVRKYIRNFIVSVLDQSYTQEQWEKFAITTIQDPELEEFRQHVVSIISASTDLSGVREKGSAVGSMRLNEANKYYLSDIIAALDRLIVNE